MLPQEQTVIIWEVFAELPEDPLRAGCLPRSEGQGFATPAGAETHVLLPEKKLHGAASFGLLASQLSQSQGSM